MPKTSVLLVTILLVTLALPASAQSVINVPGDYVDIKTAVANALTGDVILVAPGTYTGSGNRDIELFGKAITLRSTGGPSVTKIAPGTSARGFHIHHGEGRDTVIEGFKIEGGVAHSTSGATFGGGILIEESDSGVPSSPTIRNCDFRANSAMFGGGASVGYDDSNPLFDNCLFYNNEATVSGGGLEAGQGVQVWNTVFTANYADSGGAVRVGSHYTSYFLNCRFLGNYAENGGAVWTADGYQQIFRNCLFKDNFTLSSSPEDDHGGAFNGALGAQCHFCTFIGNSATGQGETAYNSGNDTLDFYNSILWDASTNSVVNPSWLSHNDILEAALADPTNNNFSLSPEFVVGPGPDGSYYLSPISPCVNAGSAQASAVCNIGAGPGACLDKATTRTDLIGDSGTADIGFHYFKPIFYDGFETGDSSQWSYR